MTLFAHGTEGGEWTCLAVGARLPEVKYTINTNFNLLFFDIVV